MVGHSEHIGILHPIIKMLGNLESCLKMCILDWQNDACQEKLLSVFLEEGESVLLLIVSHTELCRTAIPLRKDAQRDIDVDAWRQKLGDALSAICFARMSKGMEVEAYAMVNNIIDAITELNGVLNDYNDPQQYIDYCNAELEHFRNTRWCKVTKKLVSALNTHTNQEQLDYCMTCYDAEIGALRVISPALVNDDENCINKEAVGRYIWNSVDNDTCAQADDILMHICNADFYMAKSSGCETEIHDPQMMSASSYVTKINCHLTPKWHAKGTKLWARILSNRAVVNWLKDTGRSGHKVFSKAKLHRIICTLRDIGVYIEYGSKSYPSIREILKDLQFPNYTDNSDLRKQLNTPLDSQDPLCITIRNIVGGF